MKKYALETYVGAFVLIGLLCIAYLTLTLGDISFFSRSHYPLEARFNSVAGLKEGSIVSIGGVQIGQIEGITLDPEYFEAVVTFQIQNEYSLYDDSIASIKTNGLIGDKYIDISPGGSGIPLESGEEITETVSALDLESLISKFAFGSVDK